MRLRSASIAENSSSAILRRNACSRSRYRASHAMNAAATSEIPVAVASKITARFGVHHGGVCRIFTSAAERSNN